VPRRAAPQARAIVEANGLSAKITLIKGRVESVDIPVDKVRPGTRQAVGGAGEGTACGAAGSAAALAAGGRVGTSGG
jgi:hypothetical protein